MICYSLLQRIICIIFYRYVSIFIILYNWNHLYTLWVLTVSFFTEFWLSKEERIAMINLNCLLCHWWHCMEKMLLYHVLSLYKFVLFSLNALFYALATLLYSCTSILILSPLLPSPRQPCNLIQHLKQKDRHSSTSKGPLSSSRVVLDISLLR